MTGGNSLQYRQFRLLFAAVCAVSILTVVAWGCSELPTSGVDGPNTAPVAKILSPVSPDSGKGNGNPPARFRQGEEIYFDGHAYDAEEDTLDGKSVNWTSDKDGVIGTGRSFIRSELSKGLHMVALTVIDGNGAIGRDTVRLVITGGGTGNPHKDGLEVNILSKGRGLHYFMGETIILEGEAIDEEGNELSGESLEWSSDVAGELGTGQEIDLTGLLSRGKHTITLTATDSTGMSGTDWVNVILTRKGGQGNGKSGEVEITAPKKKHFFEGDDIVLEGIATDDEGNELEGEGLQWSSDLDGDLGSGQVLDVTGSLSLGNHTITLKATDGDTDIGSDWIKLNITRKGGQGNDKAADVEITAPMKKHFFEGDEIVLEGRATDAEGNELEGEALQWSSDLDGELGSGGILDITGMLSLGNHTITLDAIVEEELIGSASIKINITRKGGGK